MLKLLVLGLALGLAQSSYLNYESKELPDSREHGTKPGTRTTNCACGWTNKGQGRIVGGKETERNEYPLLAALLNKPKNYVFCGGSIVTKRHVLTAAHCTTPNKDTPLAVIVGVHYYIWTLSEPHKQVVDVQSTIEHESYNLRQGHESDIALMVLAKDIEFNQFVGPVCLPSGPVDPATLVDSYLKVLGWGKLGNGWSSRTPQKVDLRVILLQECKNRYKAFIDTVKPSQICTYRRKKDSCQGDSGGPLIQLDPETNRYTQRGIVSYGKECASEDPGVNTDVSAYVQWIKQKVAQTGLQICSKV